MIEALVALAHAVHAVHSLLPDLIRLIKLYPEMFLGLLVLMLAALLVAILIHRPRKRHPLTIR
jgi:hypothetical protein